MTSSRPVRLSGYAATIVVALVVVSVAYANAARSVRVLTAWTDVGQLSVPRAYGTATALPDGTILLVGGLDAGARDRTTTTAELFEPATGRAMVLPQRVLGRIHHTATLVGGRVIVTGGVELFGKTVSALDRTDVYDVKTRTWAVAGSLRQARTDFGATALLDGRVFVTGGHDGPTLLASSEIFDPATGTWTPAAPMPAARAQFTIATLPDGRVLVAGGIVFPGSPTATSLLYEPRLDKWTSGPAMSVERVLHTDAQLPDGSVVLVGGQRDAAATAEVYDPRTSLFRTLGTLLQPRMLAQSAVLDDGSILVTGGLPPAEQNASFSPLATAERFDPAAGRFEPAPAPSEARAFASLLVIGEGVYQVGGLLTGEAPTRTVERLDYR